MAYNDDNQFGGSAAADKPATQKLSKKLSQNFERSKEVAADGFEKTKVVASVGFEKSKIAAKKVKEVSSAGVYWIKLKYNKSKLAQKKY